MRWPVVSSLRCVQRTAFGAAEVPDVNSSAHRTSGSQSTSPMRRPIVRRLGPLSPAVASARPTTRPSTGRIIGVGEPLRDEDAARQVQPVDSWFEQCLMARLGDQELDVGVRDVTSQVLVAPGVVQPDQHRPHEPGAAQREHIVRGVVEKHGDMGRPIAVEPGRKSAANRSASRRSSPCVQIWSPKRSAGRLAELVVEAVASQEGGDVPGGEGHLAQGWGEHDTFRHFSRSSPAPNGVAA